jgi:DNA-binding transcriptional LysR family regulator
MIEEVRAGVIDLALVGCAAAPPSDLESVSIVSEGLVGLVPRDHAFADLPNIALAEIVAHPLICLPPGTGIRTVLDQACVSQGVQPIVALQASAPDAVIDLARRGLGVAILSESMTTQHHDHLTAVPLTGVDIPVVLALIWKHTPSPAVHELVRHCQMTFIGPGGQ